MSSREQNRAWAMTMAVAAVLAYTTGCTDNNSSSTAESTQTTAATSELEAESTTTDSEHSESTVATPLSDSEQRVDYDDDDKTSTYDTFDAEITLSGTTADVTGNTDAVSVSDRTVTIQNGGTYRITGTWKDGQLRVFTAAACNQGSRKRINHCTWFPVLLHGLQKFDVILLLLFFAVMALQQAFFLVDDVEPCLHRLVVGDTFRVVAFHDTFQLVRHFHFFLFYDFIVADDVQFDFRSNH